jgi:hypothetical protein
MGGIWTPTLAGEGTYTYTVMATEPCTTPATAKVVVSEQAQPNAGTDGVLTICAGSTVTAAQLFAQLGGTPDMSGTWTPTLAGEGTYTYTVMATEPCTTPATAKVVVSELTPTVPIFTAVDPICAGATLSALPTTSNNSITGTWSPVLNNMATTEYTFTPDAGQCATTAKLTISVNAPTLTLDPTQPTCSVVTGSIAVVNPVAGYTYKLNNGSFGTTTSFPNLAAGMYTVTAKDGVTGCETSKSVQLVLPITACVKPDIMVNAAVSGNTATFTWTEGCYKRYRLQHRRLISPTSATAWILILIPTGQSSYQASSLANGTYQWGLRGDCVSTNVWSLVSVGNNFTIPGSSGLVSNQTGMDTTTAISVSPNPTRDFIQVQLPHTEGFSGYVRLVDNLGRTIFGTEVATGDASVTIPVYNIASGIYNVQLITNTGAIQVERVVVQN